MHPGMNITNPILRGFNPDPSILRVGDDYYIATSTFEWYPGVQIHHSRDLVHWRLLTRPLRRASQLDLRGDPDSCGVWAPCLTHADGLFHLLVAEGGTFWGHAVTMARTPYIEAPSGVHPDAPILTARDRGEGPLPRAAPGSLVETPDGETYMAYLCGRALRNRGRCV